MALTPRERAILDFEESWWRSPGVKTVAIRQRLGMSPTHYYKRLAELVDRPEAMHHAPLVVRRLRRRRSERRRGRYEGLAAPQHPRR